MRGARPGKPVRQTAAVRAAALHIRRVATVTLGIRAGHSMAISGRHPDCPLGSSLVVSTIAFGGWFQPADSGVTSLGSRSRLSLLLMVVLAVALADCQQQINFPAPSIKALSPTSIQAGGPSFTLTVTGKSFTPSSTIDWNGQTLASPSNPGLPSTLFVSSTTLTVLVPATLIQRWGRGAGPGVDAATGRRRHACASLYD